MYEHRLHHSGGFSTNTVARRRRLHAARRRTAEVKARIAALHATTTMAGPPGQNPPSTTGR